MECFLNHIPQVYTLDVPEELLLGLLSGGGGGAGLNLIGMGE